MVAIVPNMHPAMPAAMAIRTWFAGGGVQGGTTYGQSDQWAWKSETGTTSHDMHSIILHLLGVDHEKLTVRHNGIDRRLTDVHGHVIRDILA